MSLVEPAFLFVSAALFVYFVVYLLATFTLLGISLVQTTLTKIERGDAFTPPRRLRRPGISVIAPAYNMAPIIVASARSLLASDYTPLQVVIVDDGSEDGTTPVLVAALDMIELPVGDRLRIPTAPITHIYVSRADPRLRLVRKENGGRSDAVNAGLNVAYTELVAITDADTLLERDALARIAEVFAAEPDDTVAVGGQVRIANGARIIDAAVAEPRVARDAIAATQTAEYLRGFLGSRIAWSRLNGLLILSGAFGVFRRDLLRDLGGLSAATLGEDMEITLRLHHRLRRSHPRARVVLAPDANAWTEVPTALAPLCHQRIRWHVGLLDDLRMHRGMLLRRRYGAVGLWALPYAIAFEIASPILQVGGWAIVLVLGLRGDLSWRYAAAFLVVSLLVGQLQTAGAILVEETGFRRYRTRDLMALAGWSLLELLWYRPLLTVWRLWATFLFALGRRPGWGSIPRGTALAGEEPAPPVPAPLPR